jgi:hypothetical protein
VSGTALMSSDVPRFRNAGDWFVTSQRDGVSCVRVVATAERTMDLLHALSLHLDPAVDVELHDMRRGRQWHGELLPLPDLREVVGRLRLPVSAHGGVEISLYTDVDQLTVTPELLLVVYSRSERWPFLLAGLGLEECAVMPPPHWMPARSALAPQPEVEMAIDRAVERLTLREVVG